MNHVIAPDSRFSTLHSILQNYINDGSKYAEASLAATDIYLENEQNKTLFKNIELVLEKNKKEDGYDFRNIGIEIATLFVNRNHKVK